MLFVPTSIEGAYVLQDEVQHDERGWLTRTFCAEEFGRRGIDSRAVQTSLAFNRSERTLRGLHWQSSPHGETKLIRCLRGQLFDVLVDVRRDSPTFRQRVTSLLSEDLPLSLVAPPGVAHGYLTMTPGCLLYYQMSAPFVAEAATGVRWDDPDLAIAWPAEPAVISDRDRRLPLLGEIA